MKEPRWIGYSQADRILKSMRDLMEAPKRPRMPNVLIVSEPNNGKTTIVRRFQDLHGQGSVNEDAEPVKPVIVTDAPPSADEKGLYVAILERFWAPYRPTDSAVKLRYQVIHLMRQCHVRIVVVDELHNLLTGTMTKQREVMNAVKLLCNELMIPIVGVGTRAAVRVLHTDPQHASRFDVVSLPLWELNREFRQLLASFECVLPLRNPSELHKGETAGLLQAVSGGNIGNLHSLLVKCAAEAIQNGEERIHKATIDRVARENAKSGARGAAS